MLKKQKKQTKKKLRSKDRGFSSFSLYSNQKIVVKSYSLLLIIIGSIALNWQYKPLLIQSQEPAPVAEKIVPIVIKKNPLPTHIKIGTLIDEIVEEHSLAEDGMPTVSSEHASYFTDSARPGEVGNMIIYGHNKRHIFGNLTAVKVGEIIDITTEDNTILQYKVTEIKTVDTTQTHWLEHTDNAVITIYTCTGWMDSLRFIVRGELVTS